VKEWQTGSGLYHRASACAHPIAPGASIVVEHHVDFALQLLDQGILERLAEELKQQVTRLVAELRKGRMHLLHFAHGLFESENLCDESLAPLSRAALRAIFGDLNECGCDEVLEVGALFKFVRQLEEGFAVSNEKLHKVEAIVDGF